MNEFYNTSSWKVDTVLHNLKREYVAYPVLYFCHLITWITVPVAHML